MERKAVKIQYFEVIQLCDCGGEFKEVGDGLLDGNSLKLVMPLPNSEFLHKCDNCGIEKSLTRNTLISFIKEGIRQCLQKNSYTPA